MQPRDALAGQPGVDVLAVHPTVALVIGLVE